MRILPIEDASSAQLQKAGRILARCHNVGRPKSLHIAEVRATAALRVTSAHRNRVLLLSDNTQHHSICVVETKVRPGADSVRCSVYAENKEDVVPLAMGAMTVARNLSRHTVQLTLPSHLECREALHRIGFAPKSATIESARRLHLPITIEQPQLPEVEAIGYWDSCPDNYAESICSLKTDLQQTARGDRSSDFGKVDVGALRADELAAKAKGSPVAGLLVVNQGKALIGVADFLRDFPNERCVMHQDTAIAAHYRGRGYGTWLKSEAIRWAARQFRDKDTIWTRNNEKNDAIIRINRRLGFQPVARLLWFESRFEGN